MKITTHAIENMKINIHTLTSLYTGGVDYRDVSVDLHLMAGDERRCEGIVILADDVVEEDETFHVIVEELGISTTVTILDDGISKII